MQCFGTPTFKVMRTIITRFFSNTHTLISVPVTYFATTNVLHASTSSFRSIHQKRGAVRILSASPRRTLKRDPQSSRRI